MSIQDTEPAWKGKIRIESAEKESIATGAGTFTALAKVGQQPQPGTQGYEALQVVLAKAVTTGNPVQVLLTSGESTA